MNHDGSFNDHPVTGFHTNLSHNGEITGVHSHNLQGGKMVWDNDGNFHGQTTHNNVTGHHDYWDANHQLLGTSMPGFGQDNFLAADGHMTHTPSLLHSDHINSMRTQLLNKIR